MTIPSKPSASLNDANPLLAELFIKAKAVFEKENPKRFIRITSVYRPQAIQETLYLQGRASLAIVNTQRRNVSLPPILLCENRIVTWTRSSMHTVYPSKAIDVAILFDPDGPEGQIKPLLDWNDIGPYYAFGAIAKEHLLVWGGNFGKPDYCHIQLGAS